MRSFAALMLFAAAAIALSGCTEFSRDRLFTQLEEFSCYIAGNVEGAEPCPVPEPRPEQPPLYCYQTLAGVECYAERVTFGPEPVWVRAAPPDIVAE
ncbi:MAG: hypothetical protein O3C09_04560 [Proteobacteria bacterium]|nr:hypothetical protein [Pseudomonadota bacterium]